MRSETSPTTASNQKAIQIQNDILAAEKKRELEQQEEKLKLERASKKFYSLS